MPKTNFCKPKQDKRRDYVREVIMGGLGRNHMMMKDLAVETGININTLYKRKDDPESIRLKELWSIWDVLEPDEIFMKKILLKGEK